MDESNDQARHPLEEKDQRPWRGTTITYAWGDFYHERLQLCAPASLLCFSTEELDLLLVGTSTE